MFESAKLKSERANHHIKDLQAQFRAFIEANPYDVAVGHNPDTGRAAVRLVFKQKIPTSFALTIGDAVHNMRTALDHLVWELVGRDGGTQDRYLKLPTGDNQINFEASCKGIKTPSLAVIDLLKSLEVFPTGKGDAVYRLHLMDNADKHTVLTPILRAATISKLLLFNADGTLSATLVNNTFAGGSGPFADIWNVPVGGYVKIDEDTKATPDIFLGFVTGVLPQPVFQLLSEFRLATLNTIEIVERSLT